MTTATVASNAALYLLSHSHIPFFREYMRSLGTAHWPLDEPDQGYPLNESDRRRQLFMRQTTVECFQVRSEVIVLVYLGGLHFLCVLHLFI